MKNPRAGVVPRTFYSHDRPRDGGRAAQACNGAGGGKASSPHGERLVPGFPPPFHIPSSIPPLKGGKEKETKNTEKITHVPAKAWFAGTRVRAAEIKEKEQVNAPSKEAPRALLTEMDSRLLGHIGSRHRLRPSPTYKSR